MPITELKDWLGFATPLIVAVVLPAILYWLSKQFPSRVEVARDFADLKDRVGKTEQRLDSGERRFGTLETAIREATHAAEEAKRAAQRATDAADKIGDMRVSMADLNGELKVVSALLKRVEQSNGLLLEGHLDTD